MSQKIIQFEIVTPERVVLKQEALQVTIPTSSGEITILPDHIPLVSILQPGVIEVKRIDNVVEIMSVSGGFVEIMKDKVVVLADTAERAEEIDEQAVEEARQRAEETKKKVEAKDQVEFTEVAVKLERELARLKAVNRWRRLKGTDSKN